MATRSWFRRSGLMASMVLSLAPGAAGVVVAQDLAPQTAGGLTVYAGVIPAALIKGPGPHSRERPLHGRVPKGRHDVHVTAAVFDALSQQRVADATVTAQVSGVGLSGSRTVLEPMQIAGTTTYGAFVTVPGADLYVLKLTVARPSVQQPVTFTFRYDHRR